MTPRNNEPSASCYNKKKNFPVENQNDVEMKDVVPSLLHKKHKVVKLVKSQLQKIHEEGLFCNSQGTDTEIYIVENEQRLRRDADGRPGTSKSGGPAQLRMGGEEVDMNRTNENMGGICLCFYLVAFMLAIFLLIFIAVWVSAGPLSNSMAHTPLPSGSFVTTDGLCSLEKKYLLRWSKPEYFE